VVNSLERGFQGENLSVDDWGLLRDWGLRQDLQFKQLGEQDGFVTRTAVAAETERAAEEVVLCTTSVADHAFAAHAALVHGVRHQCTSPTQLSAQLTVIDFGELCAAESDGTLTAGLRALPSTRAGQRVCTHRAVRHAAGGRAVTRGVTDGLCGGGRHAASPMSESESNPGSGGGRGVCCSVASLAR
jgi:hypothetical protein